MRLIMQGHQNRFELENVIRLFLPQEKIVTDQTPEAGGIEALTSLEKGADTTRLTCRLRVAGFDRTLTGEVENAHPAYDSECEFILADRLYRLLEAWTGIRPPWGLGDRRTPGQTAAPFGERYGGRGGRRRITGPSAGHPRKDGALSGNPEE